MYRQPPDNPRLPTEEVWKRCCDFNRAQNPQNAPKIDKRIKYDERYRKRNPLHTTRLRFRAALRNGDVIPEPCEICGTTEDIHGHHPDYSKPLEVIWLCRKHHAALHKELRSLNIS